MNDFDLFMEIPVGLKITERQRKAIDNLNLSNRRSVIKALMRQHGIDKKKEEPHYGDATAKELDNYMQNYTMP